MIPTGITHTDVALVALLRRGGDQRLVDVEHVAVEALSISPQGFRLRHYPEHPDLEATRVALHREPGTSRKGHRWVITGDRGRARMLTAEGLIRAQHAEEALRTAASEPTKAAPQRTFPSAIARMLRHPALARWQSGGIATVDGEDVADLLLVAPGETADALRRRAARARTTALSWGQHDLAKMLEEISADADKIVGGTA